MIELCSALLLLCPFFNYYYSGMDADPTRHVHTSLNPTGKSAHSSIVAFWIYPNSKIVFERAGHGVLLQYITSKPPMARVLECLRHFHFLMSHLGRIRAPKEIGGVTHRYNRSHPIHTNISHSIGVAKWMLLQLSTTSVLNASHSK